MSFVAAIPPDAVPLKPAWSDLLASVRFARTFAWQFGSGSAMLRCAEQRPRRRLTERRSDEGIRFRLDWRRWGAAFARSTGSAREIGFVADDGSGIASLRLEHVDDAVDELIWRLIDDAALHAPIAVCRADERCGAIDRERIAGELALAPTRAAFDALARRARIARGEALDLAGPHVARRLASSVLAQALNEAQRVGLTVRTRIENAGGDVTWSPMHVAFEADASGATLRAGGVDVTVPLPAAGLWAVDLDTPDVCCPALECCSAGDDGWIRIDVAATSEADCAAWRRICATLPEN